jgi:GNAT superfamily N-acetyltransferase
MKFKEKFMMYDFESDSNLYTLSLIDGINYVGRIDFSKKHNVITIVFIFVDGIHRRKGYATKMLSELNRKYNIEWDGRFTEIGRKFYESFYKKNKRGTKICHTNADK